MAEGGAAGWELEAARKLLAQFVPEDDLEAYGTLLAQHDFPRPDAEAQLGPPMVQNLIDSGLAHVISGSPGPPRLVPSPPDLALNAAMGRLERRVLELFGLLTTGRQLLGGLDRPAGHGRMAVDDLVEVVCDKAEIGRMSQTLMNAAQADWMGLENTLFETPIDDATLCAPPPVFEGRVRSRSIYDAASTTHTIMAKIIQASVDAGEEARVLPRIGMKMKLADEAVAMLPLSYTGMAGALIIRTPVITSALREYFELLWQRAIPYGEKRVGDGPLSQAQTKVMRLLAEGLTDCEIARRLQISTTTVGRHFSSVSELLYGEGVHRSRFAVGAACVRNGWID